MDKILENIKNFILKWYNRFRTFCYLFAIWAVIYSSISIAGFKVAIEYDDGIVYSEEAKKKALENPDNYYARLNLNTEYERIKLIPFLTLTFFKLCGFKVDFIVDREEMNTQNINIKWSGLADNIFFVPDQNKKYEILESKRYLLFFANSDEGIIQARKSGVIPIRIKRSPKSLTRTLSYNPGKFKERILPLSEF